MSYFYRLFTFFVFSFICINYAQASKTNSVNDSDKYFAEIFKIEDPQKISDIQIVNLKSFSEENYKSLGNIIVMNTLSYEKQNKNNSVETISDMFKSILNSKNDKILKDYATLIYGKILLKHMDFSRFQNEILPIINANDFTFKINGTEMLIIYNNLDKNTKQLSIENIEHLNPKLRNSIKRLKILVNQSQK